LAGILPASGRLRGEEAAGCDEHAYLIAELIEHCVVVKQENANTVTCSCLPMNTVIDSKTRHTTPVCKTTKEEKRVWDSREILHHWAPLHYHAFDGRYVNLKFATGGYDPISLVKYTFPRETLCCNVAAR
jgi:hypothetical protein